MSLYTMSADSVDPCVTALTSRAVSPMKQCSARVQNINLQFSRIVELIFKLFYIRSLSWMQCIELRAGWRTWLA